MKQLIFIFLVFAQTICFSQDVTKVKKEIMKEAYELYKSEKASWNGTDIFLGAYKEHENIGGYFSYSQNDSTFCIFHSREETPIVLGSIGFDSLFDASMANLELKERKFTESESNLFQMKQNTIERISNDTLFKHYNNANLNLIPLIYENEKKLYILTGPAVHGVVLFGNDYLITFNEKNEIKKAKALHKNLIALEFDAENPEEGRTLHSHLPETGDFITVTDVCTIMLYAEYANWTQHQVVSENYWSIFNCEDNSLEILSMDLVTKINESETKESKKEKKRKERKNKKGN